MLSAVMKLRLNLIANLLLGIAFAAYAQNADTASVRVASPDGNIVFRLLDTPPALGTTTPKKEKLRFAIDLRGKNLIDESALGLKLHADFPSAVKSMTRLARTFEPDASHVARYDELYTRVYSRMYERLEPLYRELRQVLG